MPVNKTQKITAVKECMLLERQKRNRMISDRKKLHEGHHDIRKRDEWSRPLFREKRLSWDLCDRESRCKDQGGKCRQT